MERFAINILHKKIQNICRLCGVDNPDKVPIIEEDDVICLDDDETTLVRKIIECVGIMVSPTDQMPQQICTLCIDKVNDFYEYRSMCAATNIQTRTILNLPLVNPSTTLIKAEPIADAVPEETTIDEKPSAKRGAKTRSRKTDDADLKESVGASSEKRIKHEFICQYCNEAFDKQLDLERHLVVKHTPLIRRFGCGTCAELFDTAAELKDHNLWHKLTRTMFNCPRCKRKFVKSGTLSKHMEMNTCTRTTQKTPTILVPDMRCKLCKKTFKTKNLYEWHGCFLRARANCPKCKKYFLKKNLLMRHYILYCTGTLLPIEPDFVPKEEPVTVGLNGLADATTTAVGTGNEGKKRGRPRAVAQPNVLERMKEETSELPFPPLLDLPEVKLESTFNDESPPDENADPRGDVRKRSKVTLDEETDKINTLLRSGAGVDGNSDIATISSILSSVNEAIATISHVRKRKKRKDSSAETVEENIDAEKSVHQPLPMVVLSMSQPVHEACEDHSTHQMFDASVIASVQNMLNITSTDANGDENTTINANNAEDGEAGFDAGESFADGDNEDTSDDEEAGGGGNNMEESISSGGAFPFNPPSTKSTPERDTGSTQTEQPFVQVKEEPMHYDDDSEADVGEYEAAMSCLAIKHEPSDENYVESNLPEEESSQCSERRTQNAPSLQALRIKIKKEKGLLNATVVEEESEPNSARITSSFAPTSSQHGAVRQQRKQAKVANTSKSHALRSGPTTSLETELHTEPTPIAEQEVRREPTPPVAATIVRIKQEPHAPDDAQQHSEENQTKETRHTGSVLHNSVRIKQEPLYDCSGSSTPRPVPSSFEQNDDSSSDEQIAFDGMRIKRERMVSSPMTATALTNRSASEPVNADRSSYLSALKKTSNPLRRAALGVERSRTNSSKLFDVNSGGGKGSASHRSNKMINPFALIKQKSLSRPDTQGPLANENIVSTAGMLSLPVISKVTSIDLKEHLAQVLDPFVTEAPVQAINDEAAGHSKDVTQIEPDKEVLVPPSANVALSALTGTGANIVMQLPEENVIVQLETDEMTIASELATTEKYEEAKECASPTRATSHIVLQNDAPQNFQTIPELKLQKQVPVDSEKPCSDGKEIDAGEIRECSREKSSGTKTGTLLCEDSNELRPEEGKIGSPSKAQEPTARITEEPSAKDTAKSTDEHLNSSTEADEEERSNNVLESSEERCHSGTEHEKT